MSPEQLVSLHPELYHMTDLRNWCGIRSDGLLSTSALLDAYGVEGATRHAIESCCRGNETHIVTKRNRQSAVNGAATGARDGGGAFISDQHIIQVPALRRALVDITMEQWLRLLNARVYFWAHRDRLARMLKFYSDKPHLLLTLDTKKLVEACGDRIELSHINSGFCNGAFRPIPRGRFTFVPLRDYQYSTRNKIAEVTVPGGIKDVLPMTVSVVALRPGRLDRMLYPPDRAAGSEHGGIGGARPGRARVAATA